MESSPNEFWELTPAASPFLASWVETFPFEKARDRAVKDRQARRGTDRQQAGGYGPVTLERAGMQANLHARRLICLVLCYLSFTSLPEPLHQPHTNPNALP